MAVSALRGKLGSTVSAWAAPAAACRASLARAPLSADEALHGCRSQIPLGQLAASAGSAAAGFKSGAAPAIWPRACRASPVAASGVSSGCSNPTGSGISAGIGRSAGAGPWASSSGGMFGITAAAPVSPPQPALQALHAAPDRRVARAVAADNGSSQDPGDFLEGQAGDPQLADMREPRFLDTPANGARIAYHQVKSFCRTPIKTSTDQAEFS